MKHQLLLTAAFGILTATQVAAQTTPTYAPDTGSVNGAKFIYVQQPPVFPGGQVAMYQAIGENIYYPTEALQQRLEGRVFISFVVGTTGAVQEVKVSKSVHPLLDAAAVRAVELLPAFTPGKQVGRPVQVAFTIPIGFRLPPNLKQILAERAAAKTDTVPASK